MFSVFYIYMNIYINISHALFDFLIPLSSPVISPPCRLRGGYAVISHVKVHFMLIPHQHAFPLLRWKQVFYTDNTRKKKKKREHDTNQWHCDSSDWAAHECVNACMRLWMCKGRFSSNKIWTKKKKGKKNTRSDHQSSIRTIKAFSVYTYYSTSLKSTTERGEYRDTGSEIERASTATFVAP